MILTHYPSITLSSGVAEILDESLFAIRQCDDAGNNHLIVLTLGDIQALIATHV